MGVYHLMGLGRSPGAVTGPLSYLGYRYQHWNANDQNFFSRSGETSQRKSDKKVGDVQSLVLFTTPEILTGELNSYDFVDNPPGRVTKHQLQIGGEMKTILPCLLKAVWPEVSGGRNKGSIFWCEIDRRNILTTYERIVQVVASLAGVGRQGKEVWANLTGGNNVTNFALELAATLSGDIARLYYVQAENSDSEKCVHFTAREGYWVDLPVMPLKLSSINIAVLDLLGTENSLSLEELHNRLSGHENCWNQMQGVSSEDFRKVYLKPMWKQGLLAESEKKYVIGPQWHLIKPYEKILQTSRNTGRTIEELTQQENWIEREQIDL